MRSTIAQLKYALRSVRKSEEMIKADALASDLLKYLKNIVKSDIKKFTCTCIIVNILVYCYSQQQMFIRCGNTFSTKFLVTNRVKEGVIISPCLFVVYINNLSLSLNSSSIGRSLRDNIINHLWYEDDLSLISLIYV